MKLYVAPLSNNPTCSWPLQVINIYNNYLMAVILYTEALAMRWKFASDPTISFLRLSPPWLPAWRWAQPLVKQDLLNHDIMDVCHLVCCYLVHVLGFSKMSNTHFWYGLSCHSDDTWLHASRRRQLAPCPSHMTTNLCWVIFSDCWSTKKTPGPFYHRHHYYYFYGETVVWSPSTQSVLAQLWQQLCRLNRNYARVH